MIFHKKNSICIGLDNNFRHLAFLKYISTHYNGIHAQMK